MSWSRWPGNRRRRDKRAPLPQFLERVEVVHELDAAERVCPHDGAMLERLYSLVETAKANDLEPYAYLPQATSVDDVEALLPWNVTNEPLIL